MLGINYPPPPTPTPCFFYPMWEPVACTRPIRVAALQSIFPSKSADLSTNQLRDGATRRLTALETVLKIQINKFQVAIFTDIRVTALQAAAIQH